MDNTFPSFLLVGHEGSHFLGGFDLDLAIEGARQIEAGRGPTIIRIEQGTKTVLEGAELRRIVMDG